jgi:hypothetical protein
MKKNHESKGSKINYDDFEDFEINGRKLTQSEIKEIENSFVTNFGSPGETSKVLSKNYYSLFFNGQKDAETAKEFLTYRNDTNQAISGKSIEYFILYRIAVKYHKRVTLLILATSYFEYLIIDSPLYNSGLNNFIFSIIVSEHNKVCPIGQEEESFVDDSVIRDIFNLINNT